MSETCSSRPEAGDPLRIWSVDRLRELAGRLPIKKVRLADLTDLDRVGWYGREEHCGRLTCREVAEHARRIDAADLSCPIILSSEGHLMDGFHRVSKAHLLGLEELPAVQFTEDPEPDRMRPMPEWLRKTLPAPP